jgi:flagellar motor protein MotB
MFRPSTQPRRTPEAVRYWISYSDLMAAMLLVFILLLIGSLILSRSDLEEQQDELLRAQTELNETLLELDALDTRLSGILGVRGAIIERLRTRFDDEEAAIVFDDATGAILLGSGILFAEGSARLSPEGRDTLDRLIPVYFEALLGDELLREHVGQIVFEGHTNSNYSGSDDPADAYLFNLKLSQDRAYTAMEYVIANALGEEFNAKDLLVAVGYSSSRTLDLPDSPGVEDEERSRRLEIRFRLKDEESMSELRRLISEDRLTPPPAN